MVHGNVEPHDTAAWPAAPQTTQWQGCCWQAAHATSTPPQVPSPLSRQY